MVDIRNSLTLKLIRDLKRNHFHGRIHDPYEHGPVPGEYPLKLEPFADIDTLSVAIITVRDDFYQQQGLQTFVNKCQQPAIIMDLSNMFAQEAVNDKTLVYWSL